jgi:hypothetical protein
MPGSLFAEVAVAVPLDVLVDRAGGDGAVDAAIRNDRRGLERSRRQTGAGRATPQARAACIALSAGHLPGTAADPSVTSVWVVCAPEVVRRQCHVAVAAAANFGRLKLEERVTIGGLVARRDGDLQPDLRIVDKMSGAEHRRLAAGACVVRHAVVEGAHWLRKRRSAPFGGVDSMNT